jgi:hypothetical protein
MAGRSRFLTLAFHNMNEIVKKHNEIIALLKDVIIKKKVTA